MRIISTVRIVLAAVAVQLLTYAGMVASVNAQTSLQWQPEDHSVADVSQHELDPATLATPAQSLTLAVGWTEHVTMSLYTGEDANRTGGTRLATLGNATPDRSDFLERTELHTRVNVFKFQNSHLDIEQSKDKDADERGVGVAFDSATSGTLRFEGQVVRPRHGKMQYLVGVERTNRRLKHGTVTTLGVGHTGNGGLGSKLTTRLDLSGSDSALLLSTSAGDRGVDLLGITTHPNCAFTM